MTSGFCAASPQAASPSSTATAPPIRRRQALAMNGGRIAHVDGLFHACGFYSPVPPSASFALKGNCFSSSAANTRRALLGSI